MCLQAKTAITSQRKVEKFQESQLEQSLQGDNADMNKGFLSNPLEGIKLQALAKFIDRTDNFHTRQLPCMSCAREDFVCNMKTIYIRKIPRAI